MHWSFSTEVHCIEWKKRKTRQLLGKLSFFSVQTLEGNKWNEKKRHIEQDIRRFIYFITFVLLFPLALALGLCLVGGIKQKCITYHAMASICTIHAVHLFKIYHFFVFALPTWDQWKTMKIIWNYCQLFIFYCWLWISIAISMAASFICMRTLIPGDSIDSCIWNVYRYVIHVRAGCFNIHERNGSISMQLR